MVAAAMVVILDTYGYIGNNRWKLFRDKLPDAPVGDDNAGVRSLDRSIERAISSFRRVARSDLNPATRSVVTSGEEGEEGNLRRQSVFRFHGLAGISTAVGKFSAVCARAASAPPLVGG